MTRDRLLTTLDQWRDYSLLLVVSPAGFGKTTLLSSWHASLRSTLPDTTAWLTADADDLEPARLVSDIILAFTHTRLALGNLRNAAESELLETPERSALLTLLAHLSGDQNSYVLIIDDYHLADSTATNRLMDLLLDKCPINLHVVLSARDIPQLHLSTLSARGGLRILSAADMKFSASESFKLFQDRLTPSEHAEFYSRTEGWPVVTQLARIWVSDPRLSQVATLHRFSGNQSDVARYISEQIIENLPRSLRNFLLDASLFDHFSAALLDYATKRRSSADMLRRLGALNALIGPSDIDAEWYRLHSIFRDYLIQYRNARQKRSTRSTLGRASTWFERRDDLLEAVRYAVHSGHLKRATRLIERAGGWRLVMTHGVGFVGTVLNVFPQATREHEYALLIMQAYFFIKRGQWNAVEQYLNLAAPIARKRGARRSSEYEIVASLRDSYFAETDGYSLAERMRSFAATLGTADHITRATALAVQALCEISLGHLQAAEDCARTGASDMEAAGCVVGRVYCLFHLGEALYYRGRWRAADNVFRESLELAEASFGKDSMLKAVASIFVARLEYERGALEVALGYLETAMATIETQDGWVDVYVVAFETRIRALSALGRDEPALSQVRHLRAFAKVRRLPMLTSLADAWAEELWDSREDTDATTGTFPSAFDQDRSDWRVRHAAAMAAATRYFRRGQLAESLRVAAAEADMCRRSGLAAHAARCDAYAAIALWGQGRKESAIQRWRRAVTFSVREHAGELLFEVGTAALPVARALLRWYDQQRGNVAVERQAVMALVRSLRQVHRPQGATLTGRELDVLRQLAKGGSNKRIATLLGISENTVKFHVKEIFRKLRVRTRVQAATAGVELLGAVDPAATMGAEPPPAVHPRRRATNA